MRKALVKRGGQIVEVMIDENTFKKGGSNMIKRKDGSYSQRGLWDNIRANKGSGKESTDEMLYQAKKIKSKHPDGGKTKSLVQPPVLLDDNIIYATDNPFLPGVNKDIIDAKYNEYEKWRREFIHNERMTPEEYYQMYPTKQEFERKIFDPSSRGVQLANGGYMYPQGGENIYTPDTGIEQYAPDQSWYEGNPNAADPGNVVSWPSYPREMGMSMNEMPDQAIPQRNSPSPGSMYLGTGRYSALSRNPMISLDNNYSNYQGDMPEYRRGLDLFNRMGQGFNDIGEAMGEGFDNLGDFFQRMKRNRKKARRGRRRGKRGNGLLNCKPGTDCFKFQEGGEGSDQMDQILDQIEDALEQGAQPEELLQQLIQMGIEQEQAQMLIQEAIQDLQEDASENELEEAQTGGSNWMQGPFDQESFDDRLRKNVFPVTLGAILAGAIPAYFVRRKEKRQEREELERLEKEENEETPTKAFGGDTDMFADGGSYRVYKTSERKGKTHKVVGPGGVTKYFGDPSLGERSKSKYGKKGFYARHKKNLAKNPFFRAYARATWAEGGEPSFMQTPDFKTNSFIDLVRQEAESNAYKNIMDQAQEMYMQMGGAQDYGYVGNPQLDMYQQNVDYLKQNGNVEGALFNGLNKIGKAAEKVGTMALNTVAPGSGTALNVLMDSQRPTSMTDPTSKGMSADGVASILKGIGSDPQALMGLFARKGGTLPKAQDGLEQYFGQFLNPKLSDQDFNADVYGNLYDENGNLKDFTALPQQQEIQRDFQSPENWAEQNKREQERINQISPNIAENKNWDPLKFSKKDIRKYNLDPNYNNIVRPPEQKPFGNGLGLLSIGKDLLTAMGNRGKGMLAEAKMSDMTASDNVFNAYAANNEGKFQRNTGKLIDRYVLGSNQAVPALSSARYGGGLKRAKQGGVQKDGMYLSYPTATPESVLYGEQPKKPSNTLQPVKREFANLEAEGGETAITPVGIDGVPKFWKIGGERHSNGGTPLNLPDGSFIFSDTNSMKLGGSILEELGIKGKKKKTPAEISKILGKGYEKFVMAIQDPTSDKIERRTAELMIENQIKKLGMLALAQEAKKGFPDGIPMIAVPYMESVGIAPEQVLPKPQMGMQEMGMQQQMPMEQMPMQGMEMPMARYGLQKYQTAGQTDMIGMNPNAPFPVSSPTAPGERNIAQEILGNLSNYFTSKPEEEEIVPVGNLLGEQEVFSPVKGFESIEDLDQFIAKGDELDQPFDLLYDYYSQTIKGIDILRNDLIQGKISLTEYENQKERIDKIIEEIKTELKKSEDEIPMRKSWGFNPRSSVDKLQDMQGILDEEKNKLKYRATDLRKFRNFQNNVSFLETEKQSIIELLNSDIDNLEKVRLRRRLTDLNDALNYETDRVAQFGEKAFKKSESRESETNIDFVNISRLKNYDNTLLEDPRKQYGRLGYRVYKYNDYLKNYGDSPLNSKTKSSVETEKGSLNATEEVTPIVQDTVPVVTPPATTTPVESKTKSKTNQSKPSKFKKVEGEDLNLF